MKKYDGVLACVVTDFGYVSSPDFVDDNGVPHRCFFSAKDIKCGKDLLKNHDHLAAAFVPEKTTAVIRTPQLQMQNFRPKMRNGKPVLNEKGQQIMIGGEPVRDSDGRQVWKYVECGTRERYVAREVVFTKC
jgi:hypothetical protein